jgi:uncharacterized membrane protein (UPF0127 family)
LRLFFEHPCTRPRFLAVIAILVLGACSAQPPATPENASESHPAQQLTDAPQAILPDGSAITLELALTPEEIQTGLMFRPTLAAGRGMLFLFDQERVPSFWMKNTLIPLDLVFLDSSGRVVDVIAGAVPCRADPCPQYVPEAPARAVLEIAAGRAAATGITKQSVLVFKRVPGYPAEEN